MPVSLGTALQVYASVVTTLLLAGLGAFAWYIRVHVTNEVTKNSQFRQYAGGTSYGDDSGRLGDLQSLTDDIERLSEQMDAQHAETGKKVDYVITYCQRIADAIEQNIEEPQRRWHHDDDD